tara:strand:- start:2988 stop:4271 length:1284 start_codon:yes stop_codon:yes gene_type:complete
MIVGNGGREHAIAWKLANSESTEKIFVAPGNAGTEKEPKVENVPIPTDAIDALVFFAKDQSIDLAIIGPEQPLVDGIANRFEDAGIPCIGPNKEAAKLEASKIFAKNFMQRHRIPTSRYKTFENSIEAIEYAKTMNPPIVIKADGLASGKGVYIAKNIVDAEFAIVSMLEQKRFGAAGDRIILEDYMKGEEMSFICLVHNEQVLPLATSQDHKARDAGDSGPNTGGMGAYSPAPEIAASLNTKIINDVINPTVRGLLQDGISYTGFLYAGLMIDQNGSPCVLEYNCRSGDPETQPILLRLKSDLVDIFCATLSGKLDNYEIEWDPRPALGVVMVSGGYPDKYGTGNNINGLEKIKNQDVKVFHAGTRLEKNQVLTNAGRVLCVTALGNNIAAAQSLAYQHVGKIGWDQAYFRTDIGYRAVERGGKLN